MAEERLQPISLHLEMQRSYLEYAMSVIVGRALPDARDGLKPVQRRILFAMHELGLSPDRPFRKCARVVGDVLGKYHPHGDQAVYDALVRLVQTFASRYPVLDGHGNFGSVDDDPPAAMRYTETRLTGISHQALLDEIGSETVDFVNNFDGSHQEPTVLPAQLPFLLLNGCAGIAVGMATSIPPHNLNEIVDGLIALIKKPDLSDEKLLKLIPGPDFPTGGEILLGSGLTETYLKGRGSIPMRGVAHIEEIQPGKGKHKRNAIVITELPYQLNKSGWIEKLAEIVNDGKISGIADIRDESDREGMRVVVELRRDANSEKVLKELYSRTALQSNFSAILLALIKGKPEQLSLRKLLQTFLDYRESTLIKRTKYKLKKTVSRLEILEGLIKALNNIKNTIQMIEEAKDSSSAKAKLMVMLEINEKQADSVLSMPLRRLTGLEQESLRKECKNLEIEEKELKSLLSNREELLEEMIKELKNLKRQFGNKRRTKLIEGGDELLAQKAASQRPSAELLKQQAFEALPKDGKILIQENNQVKIISPQVLGRMHINESCPLGDDIAPVKLILEIKTEPKILAVTESGRIALVKWEFAGQQPGLLEKFLPGGMEGDKVVNLLLLPKEEKCSLGLLSNDGRFKRLPLEDVVDLSGRATTILKLKEGIKLKSAIFCQDNSYVILGTDYGRLLKLKVNENNLPIMGKLAQGPMTMKLFPNEKIINAISWDNKKSDFLLLITKKGNMQIQSIAEIRTCERGDIGQICLKKKESKKDFALVADFCLTEGVVGIVTSLGRYGRIDTEDLHQKIHLKENEHLERVIPLIEIKEKKNIQDR